MAATTGRFIITRLCKLAVMLLVIPYIDPTDAAQCPYLCQCVGDDNLNVTCSSKLLTTIPALSVSTETLDLSNNALGPIINASFPQMSNLTSIDLSGNGLSRLLACTLSGMLSLRSVSFRGNKLSTLPGSLFDDADHVEELDLSYNQFTEFPDAALRKVTNLKFLDFSHNKIVELRFTPRFQVPRHIEFIDLSHNLFEEIHEDDFQMASGWEVGIKRVFDLSYCRISLIEAGAFLNIPNLQDLNLSGNDEMNITNITSAVKELQNRGLERLSIANMNLPNLLPFQEITELALKFLNVSNNNIEEVPDGIFSTIRSLRVLDISNNAVPSLTDAFSDLVNLVTLNASHNKMTSFHGDAVGEMTNLETLDLSSNRLSGPDDVVFTPLTKLSYLDVSSNLMKTVKLPSNTSMLVYLDYHSNRVKQFRGVTQAEALEFFDISDNELGAVEPFLFQGAKYLKMANFSRNEITTFDHRAFLPQSALVVDLSHNNLSVIRFSHWVATQKLYLQDNSLTHIDSQTFNGMTGLIVLDLSKNRLAELHENLFRHVDGLEHLNLSHNHLGDVLWFSLFQHLSLLETLDMGYNNISQLNQTMLLPLINLKTFSVRDNQLRIINPRVFRDLTKIEVIDLSNNPFQCECDMLAFRDWLLRTTIPIVGLYNNTKRVYECNGPDMRAGMHITKWDVEEFECNRSMLYLIIFGSVGLFIVVAGVVASGVYRYYKRWKKRRDAKRWRRREEYADGRKRSHAFMTSKEIAEEIQKALKRKKKLDHQRYVVADKSNGNKPLVLEVNMKDQDKNKRSEEDGQRDRAADDGRREKKEREKGAAGHYDRIRMEAKPAGSRRESDQDGGWQRSSDGAARMEGKPRESYYVNVAPNANRPEHLRALEYVRDIRRGQYERDGRYRYRPDQPRGQGPYVIPVPRGDRWENVDVWNKPRGWTIQGYGGRPRGPSHGNRGEGYMTMPAGVREVYRYESNATPDRYPQQQPPEIRYLRQPVEERDYRARNRSSSYHYLPQEYPEMSAYERRDKDRDQQQYESIHHNRRTSSFNRTASQPLLAKERGADWV